MKRLARLEIESLEERIVPSSFGRRLGGEPPVAAHVAPPLLQVNYAQTAQGDQTSGVLTFLENKTAGMLTFVRNGTYYTFAVTMNNPNLQVTFSLTASSPEALRHGFLSEVAHLQTPKTHAEWGVAVAAAERSFL